MHFPCILFIIFSTSCFVSSKSIEKRASCPYANCDQSCTTCTNSNNCNNGSCNNNNQCSTSNCNNCLQYCSGQQSCVDQQCTNTCNPCVINCNRQCESNVCRNNCIEACPESRNNCNPTQTCQNNCAECKNGCDKECPSRCQQTSTCSQNCANTCSNQCESKQCVNTCMNSCHTNDCPTLPPIPRPEKPEIFVIETNNTPSIVNVGNTTNINNINLTTHVNIHNVINNINNITVPVYINYTNINNVNINNTHETSPYQPVFPPINPPTQVCPQPSCNYSCTQNERQICETENTNCCEVYHPRQCYMDRSVQRERCVIPRHRECSDICTSPVVSINQVQEARPQCHYIRNYPYMYCGNYERTDCGQCYQCEGQYNPGYCSTTSQCSQNCRSNMVNCIPTSKGLHCL